MTNNLLSLHFEACWRRVTSVSSGHWEETADVPTKSTSPFCHYLLTGSSQGKGRSALKFATVMTMHFFCFFWCCFRTGFNLSQGRGPGRSRYECNFPAHICARINSSTLCCLEPWQDWSKVSGLRETFVDAFSYYLLPAWPFPFHVIRISREGQVFKHFLPEMAYKKILLKKKCQHTFHQTMYYKQTNKLQGRSGT